ncbi:MAG: hypothetical protein PHD43_22960 [Methylococcales bacterium]|nr:hypothetical protein [Methylococcales bacterium]
MKNTFLVIPWLVMMLLFSQGAWSAEEKIQLFMADGQLKSHPLRLFVTRDIDESMSPRLMLTGSHAITQKNAAEDQLIAPMLIAQNQKSEQTINDTQVTLTGTLLLFDLRHYPIPAYKTVMRLTPTLTWQEGSGMGSKKVAIGAHEVYLANPVPAFILPFTMVVLLILLIAFMAKRSHKSAIQFICDKEGHLSLARTQVALWTVAIGSLVTAYGFMRLEVPQIPSSLVALMGLSLATGAISYTQSEKNKDASSAAHAGVNPSSNSLHKTALADLVMDYSESPAGSLSLARAQMVLWTALTLLLFIVKSILDGNLWAVPWELVALMGLSQVGYLAPKINLKADI